jgi:hypothetical protein
MTDNNSQTGPSLTKTTIRDLLNRHNIKSSTLRMAFPNLGLSNWDINRELTAVEIAVIVEKYGAKGKQVPGTNTPQTTRTTSPKPAKQSWIPSFHFHLLDVIIWGEILLGWYSLYCLAGGAGLGFGLIAVTFYEWARRMMHKPYRMLQEGYTQGEHDAAAEFNALLRTQKQIALLVCVLVAAVFCFANWNSFNNAISKSTDLELQLVTESLSVAQTLATVFALLMSGIAYVCLRAISLNKQMITADAE